MNDNVIKASQFKEHRPKGKYQYTGENINQKISRETRLAVHSLKLFCIKNALWLIPLLLFLVFAFIIDAWIVLGFWHNPTILFNQLKYIIGFILSYIAGLYTDELRRKMTKH